MLDDGAGRRFCAFLGVLCQKGAEIGVFLRLVALFVEFGLHFAQKSSLHLRPLRGSVLPCAAVVLFGLAQEFGSFPNRLCFQIRPRQKRLHARGQVLRCLAVAVHQLRQCVVMGHGGAPIVLCGHIVLPVLFFVHFQRKRYLAIKGEILQYALAEAVDGVDGGVVELADGGFEANDQSCRRFVCHGFLQQFGQKCGGIGRVFLAEFGNVLAVSVFLQYAQRIIQPCAQPCFEFGGGGFGEGNDEDFIDRHLLQQHQPREQGGDVPSFARACAGFNQVDALNGDVER